MDKRIDRSDLTGIILAGGKSSRMGREKGLVEFRGKPLIQFEIDLLLHFTDRILISSGNPDYGSFKLEMVPDDVLGLGPAAGLASALRNSETLWNVVLACDLPFLEPELIDFLLVNTSGFQAVIPCHDGGNEPLAGLYRRDLAEQFTNAMASGTLAIHKILETVSVKYVDVSHLFVRYPLLFANFNTLQDLETGKGKNDRTINW